VLYGVPLSRRRDAQRNRAAIVEAASEMLTRRDAVVPMPEIARRAGVSQATLYRHFRDRITLVGAVVAYQLERLEASAAASRPAMFRALLREVLRHQVAMRPLVHLVQRLDAATRERYRRRLVTALSAPLRRAQEHGYVRADLAPADLVLLFLMVQGVTEATDDSAADRSIDLMLDGVFRGPA
jgi:AcrR family transcriptional regulator